EARRIYRAAQSQGFVASLLDQERTNIFTQSVANIEPGKEIEITIRYVELLPFEDGKFSFAFPTVVGPRFIPGGPLKEPDGAPLGMGWSPNTTRVPDASRITPIAVPKDTRAGHDLSIVVNIDGGLPIGDVHSNLHQITSKMLDSQHAAVELVDQHSIPNKDFVLSWNVSGEQLKNGYMTFRDPKAKSGYFTLMLLPPKRVVPEAVAPKEMIFLVDCSGSQSGPPLAKAQETLHYIVDHMNPQDTFQIISFNYSQDFLFDKPQPVTANMRVKAHTFIDKLKAEGGTFMAEAVERTCTLPADKNRLRIVSFMTDGFFGGDYEILSLVKKLRGTSRWFSFGTGNSVNRALIDGVAREGGGEADYVLLNSKPGEVGQKFYARISSPVLTDVKVKFSGVDVKDVFPNAVSDVWAQKPLYIKGRYLQPGAGTVTLSGFHAGKPYLATLKIVLPGSNLENSGIASVWARAKVDRLMAEDWEGLARGSTHTELKNEIIATAIEHHIMSPFTSFVAYDSSRVTEGDDYKKAHVPVEAPDGVSVGSGFQRNSTGIGGGVGYSLLPPTILDSAVLPQTSQGLIYGDEGTSEPFKGSRRGLTTGHGSQSESWGEGDNLLEWGDRTTGQLKKSGISHSPGAFRPALEKSKAPSSDKDAEKKPSSEFTTVDIANKEKNRAKYSAKPVSKLSERVKNLLLTARGTQLVKVEVTLRRNTRSNEELIALLKKAGLSKISIVSKPGNEFAYFTGEIEIRQVLKLAEVVTVDSIK
ncbi:MAG: VIT and VWA domain-containing protein, partial [Cyanobacteria bacterium]|nr:VIT and VWA domain-containing protein [Cyanobacteriota bacterium]